MFSYFIGYLYQMVLVYFLHIFFYNQVLKLMESVILSTLLLSSLLKTMAKCVFDNSKPKLIPKSAFIISPLLKLGLFEIFLLALFLNIVDSFFSQFIVFTTIFDCFYLILFFFMCFQFYHFFHIILVLASFYNYIYK